MIPTTDQALERDPVELTCRLHDSAVACYAQGQAKRAVSLFRRALSLLKRAAGPDHPDLANALINLAAI